MCGKPEETANLQDLLIFVLRGIAVYGEGLKDLGQPDRSNDDFVLQGLFATITNANWDDARFEGMIEEGRVLAGLDPHVVVKIPMTPEGMKAVKGLKKLGIRTNVTLVFSANQALLAARAGASFVSPFVGRIDDIGWDGIELIQTISEIFELHGIETKIIAASIRKPQHIMQCALAGADIATVPFQVLMDAMKHPLTDNGIARFKADWAKANMK